MKPFLLLAMLAASSVVAATPDTFYVNTVNTTDTSLIVKHFYSFTDSVLVDSIKFEVIHYSDTFTLWYRYYAKRNRLDTCYSFIESLLVQPVGKRAAIQTDMCPSPNYSPIHFAPSSPSYTMFLHDTITYPEYLFVVFFKDILCTGSFCQSILVKVDFYSRGGIRPCILKATPAFTGTRYGTSRTAVPNIRKNAEAYTDITGRRVPYSSKNSNSLYVFNNRLYVHLK